MMKNFTIIFRTTNSCNLNCTYCYDKNNHHNICKENEEFNLKIPKIVKYIEKLWKNKNDDSEIIFHGGEPLIINAKNYEILMGQIKTIYPNVKFSIQTNATLLNKQIIPILKKHNVHLGISLDGYNDVTNQCRIYKNGKNSFNDVMSKIDLLKQEKINFGIIMTLTKNVLNKEDELYDFLKVNKLKCNIRPAFECNNSKNVNFMSNEDYFNFFKSMFNIWIKDNGEDKIRLTQISEIYDEFAKSLDDKYENHSCSSSGRCAMNFISLDCEGNLYSCNRTYNNSNFFYGNIKDLDIDNLRESLKHNMLNREAEIKKGKCGKCKLYQECKGGCPANAYSIYSDFNMPEDSWCTAKIKIREYVIDYLDKNGIKKDYEEMRNERKLSRI